MPQLSSQLLAELNAAVARRHLDSVAQEICSNASECYAMIAVGDDDYSEMGSTRFGGDPDLPVGMQWPIDPNKSVDQWKLLLQLNSNSEMNLNINEH